MKQTITSHNTNVLKAAKQQKQQDLPDKQEKNCNCRTKKDCPMEGQCLKKCTVYQATVTQTTTNKSETYIGLTGDSFKTRYGNHKKSFNHEKYKSDTELSNHVWKLKKENIEFTIKWRIIDRGKLFNPVSKICQLCVREKFYLIFKPNLCSLNNRNELGAYCRHQKKLLHCS